MTKNKLKTTTMKTIPQHLNILPSDYEDLMMQTYMRWCMDFCRNYQGDLQSLLANAALNRYFLTEYKKLEDEFVLLISRYDGYSNITDSDKINLYSQCTVQIFNRRCMPLINQAKTLKIENYAN